MLGGRRVDRGAKQGHRIELLLRSARRPEAGPSPSGPAIARCCCARPRPARLVVVARPRRARQCGGGAAGRNCAEDESSISGVMVVYVVTDRQRGAARSMPGDGLRPVRVRDRRDLRAAGPPRSLGRRRGRTRGWPPVGGPGRAWPAPRRTRAAVASASPRMPDGERGAAGAERQPRPDRAPAGGGDAAIEPVRLEAALDGVGASNMARSATASVSHCAAGDAPAARAVRNARSCTAPTTSAWLGMCTRQQQRRRQDAA